MNLVVTQGMAIAAGTLPRGRLMLIKLRPPAPQLPATPLAWDVICPPFPESRHRSANPAKSVIKIGRGLEGVNAK